MASVLASGIVIVSLFYAFINGFHDGGNVMTTMTFSQTLRHHRIDL